MDFQEIIKKIEKILEMKADVLLVDNIYISPLNIQELLDLVPELKQNGLKIATTETEYEDGKIISSKILDDRNNSLYLGSVILTGEDVKIKDELITKDDFLIFIDDSLSQKQ